jgi:hypothetical protein
MRDVAEIREGDRHGISDRIRTCPGQERTRGRNGRATRRDAHPGTPGACDFIGAKHQGAGWFLFTSRQPARPQLRDLRGKRSQRSKRQRSSMRAVLANDGSREVPRSSGETTRFCGLSVLDNRSRMQVLESAHRRRVSRRRNAVKPGPRAKFVFFSAAIGTPCCPPSGKSSGRRPPTPTEGHLKTTK